jgi:hypothetical protein
MNRIYTLAHLMICFVLTLVSSPALLAQTDDPALSELLENFFRDNEGASESDAQLFIENLEQLRSRPLNLNTATRAELQETHLFHELQIEKLLAHRQLLGELVNIYELQAIEGWELDDIRRVTPFVEIPEGGLDERATPIGAGLLSGDNDFLMRWGRFRPVRIPDDSEGRPNQMAIRYRHNYQNRLRYGILAENDAGEAFFSGSNRGGFDFYSAFFWLKNPQHRTLRILTLGDYTVRLGQGLLIQTNFSQRKSAESVQIMRGGPRLRTYGGAFGEVTYLRGGGVILAPIKQLEVTVFASYRRRDGNLDIVTDSSDVGFGDEVFTSVAASGLHRTASEIANERSIGETLAGGAIEWSHARGFVALNAVHIRYERPWMPNPAPYRLYQFTGSEWTGISIDYQYRWRNFLLYGEEARSQNGGMSFINGAIIGADRRVRWAVVHRHFQPEYQAIYANPFGETTGADNEQGLYLGVELQPSKPYKFNAYADLWRHPWLRSTASGPSVGSEYVARFQWQPNKVFTTYAQWLWEQKQADAPTESGFTGLQDEQRQRMRLHATYKVNRYVELRSRVEWTRSNTVTAPRSGGFLMYHELMGKSLGFPLSGAVRYALFDTDNFDSRVYAYENDLFAAVSIPAFAGRGARYYLNLQYRLGRQWVLEARLEQTVYQRTVTTSITPGRYSSLKLQVRGKW